MRSSRRPLVSLLLPLFAPVLLALPASAAGAPEVFGLTAEYQTEPLSLDTLVPRLSWRLSDPDRGEGQSAYRVIVSSDPAAAAALNGDVWDSGKVSSVESVAVEYAGPALSSNTPYWWRVRVWDATDTASAWSAVSRFDVAPMGADWTAEHVWDGTTNTNNWCLLRKSFVLSTGVERARLYVTAHDDYELYVNGTLVGRGPAQADPYAMQLVEAWDVGSLLTAGENVFAAVAHYHGEGEGSGVVAEPAFLLQADVLLTDASTTRIASDATWRVQATTPWDEGSPIRGPVFAKATAVEEYDARLEIDGWLLPGFDDGSWPTASVVTPGFTLRGTFVPPREVVEEIEPVSISEPVPGVLVVDFGVNSAGWPRLTIRGASSGDQVKVWYSEELDGDRIVRDRDQITDYWDRYTCKGAAAETFEPDTRYNGFRYIEIEGYPAGGLDPADVRLVRSHTELDVTGSFESSNPLLDEIYAMCVRTERNANQGIFVDCPQREQAQYTSDLIFQGLQSFYAFDRSLLLRKAVYDFKHAQVGLPGFHLGRAPAEGVLLIPEWTLHLPLAAWEQYFHMQDERVLEDVYSEVQDIISLNEMLRSPVTGLVEGMPGWHISDWPVSPVVVEGCTVLTPENALYYAVLRTAADMADVLGLPGDASLYRSLAEEVRDGMNAFLFDGVDRYRDCLSVVDANSAVSIFPMQFGVVPEAKRADVLAFLEASNFGAAVYAGWYLMELLYAEDRTEHAYSLVNTQEDRWGLMLAEDATTCWEDWTPDFSLSHAWTASPMKFLLSGLLGVTPTSPGFATVQVRPHLPASLERASGSVPTIRGPVDVALRRFTNALRVRVDVPVGMTGEVHVPIEGRDRLFESGTPVWRDGSATGSAPGVTVLGDDGTYVRLGVGSGSYSFLMTGRGATRKGQTAPVAPVRGAASGR